MSNGDSTIPLPSRKLPDIPPPRRDGRDSSTMSQGSRMTVGPGIVLKGEISNCAALVVEGNLDATLDGESLEISQRGVFSGTARVDSADIQGHFEGDLTVTGLLRIENGGSVSGTVRYGRIEVIAGGELSGEISKVDDAPEVKKGDKAAAKAPAAAQTGSVEIAAQAD